MYKILHEDAFNWINKRKGKSIHAVVTDPPYGVIEYSPEQLIKRRTGNGGIWRLPQKFDGYERSMMPRFTVLTSSSLNQISKFHAKLAPGLFKILVPGGHVILASQNLISHIVIQSFVEAGFEMRGQIIRVVKTLRGGDRPKDAHEKYSDISVSPRACWEPWLIFRKPCEVRVKDNLVKWHTGGLRRPNKETPFSDLIYSSPARGKEKLIAPHPSLKPQAFVRQVVRASLPLAKGTILDPFMGSGSIIAAAEFNGLKSIGLEIDEEFFCLAKTAIPKLKSIELDS